MLEKNDGSSGLIGGNQGRVWLDLAKGTQCFICGFPGWRAWQ